MLCGPKVSLMQKMNALYSEGSAARKSEVKGSTTTCLL